MVGFEFTNNVFSGMLSLFAAVIGLAYPFILQMVERIRNLYVTEKVVDWFLQEKTLCHFLLLLKINIPLAILIPYLLLLFNGKSSISITLLTMQSGFVCALLCYLIRLYGLVNVYSSYIGMANYTRREDLERLAITMLSADHKDEKEAYAISRDKLYGRITEILIEEVHRSGSLEEYPAEVMQVVGTILSAAREKGKYPRTSCDTNSISLLYDAIFNKAHPTKGLRKFVWYHLNMLLKAGNTDWLKSYWEWATQFYRSMQYGKNYNDAERIEFYEMHIFFAAMVLRCKNKELMEHIMSYQDASPEPPCLLLSQFNTIIELLLKYDKLRSWPYKLVEPYQMYFFTNDVNADNNIFGVLCDYLAYSLLSITARKDIYYTCDDDYKIGQQKSKEELESEKRTLDWFRKNVLAGGICKILKQNYTNGEFNEANERMIRLTKAYEDRIKVITENDDISKKKLKAMQDEIISENRKSQIPFVKKEMEGRDVEQIEFLAQVKAEASPGQLMEHQNINSVNFGNVLIAYLRNQFYHQLTHIFLLNGSVGTYLIQYSDIRQALKKIGFDDGKYILLNNGISLWNYDLGDVMESDVITIGSGNNNMFIVKKYDCPTYMYGELDNKSEYKGLDKGNGLYWKEPTKENGLTVQVAQPFIIYNRRHTRYIKINVTYDRALGDCDLNKLKDLKTIL